MKKKILMFLMISFMVFFAGTVWGFTEGSSNNFFGLYNGTVNTGSYNSFFGGYNGTSNTTGMRNSFFGFGAGYVNNTGSENSFFGENAGQANTIGSYNSFFGTFAGFSNIDASNNTFIGHNAGRQNTTGSPNTFVGTSAGRQNTTGTYNNFFGYQAGYGNTTGDFNNYFGYRTGQSITEGTNNSFFGHGSGYFKTSGTHNSFFGSHAGANNIAGSNNVFLGNHAGYNETGSNKLYISNSDTELPLIYGEFDNEYLEINGDLSVIGYTQLDLTTNSPPAADCDDPSEYGRMKVDAVSEDLYVCVVSGWKSMQGGAGQASAVNNDFNGDGNSDVLVRNTDNGRWHMYLMDGTSNPTLVSRINMYESSAIEMMGTGDFNGDGISDVLVRNTDNGRWHMYLMDGTSNPTLVSRINMYESSAIAFQD